MMVGAAEGFPAQQRGVCCCSSKQLQDQQQQWGNKYYTRG